MNALQIERRLWTSNYHCFSKGRVRNNNVLF